MDRLRNEPGRGVGELGIALRCLAHPVSIAALALLAVNDHLWKGAGPDWLTGKLSDVAGLFYFPFLVAAACAAVGAASGWLTGRVAARSTLPAGRFAFALVAVWFAAAKTIPAAHQATVWLATVLVGPVEVVRDPTDVAALIALIPAWLLYRRVAANPTPVRRWIQAPILCVAVLLTAATSRPRAPYVDRLVEHEGALYAIVQNVPSGDPGVDRVTWTAYTTRDGSRWEPRDPLPRSVIDDHQVRRELVAGNAWLRLAGHEVYASQRGGPERRVWAMPEGRADFMRTAGGESWWMEDIAPLPDTALVVVALGSEGVLVGDGNYWTRVAVGPAAPSPWQTTPRGAMAMIRRSQWAYGAASAVVTAILFSVFCWLRPRRVHPVPARARAHGWLDALRRLRAPLATLASLRIDIGCAVAAAVAFACAALVFAMHDGLARAEPFVVAFATVPLALGVGLLVLGWLRHASWCRGRGERFQLPVRRLLSASLLGGLMALVALWAWDIGWVSSLRTTMAIATLGVVASALLLHRGKRDSDVQLATRR